MLNQTIIIKNFLWTWDKVVDASMPAMQFDYHIQIADNAEFTLPIVDSFLSATTINYVTDFPLGAILYFRVRARNTVLIESFNWASTQGEVGTISGGNPGDASTINLFVCVDTEIIAGDFLNIHFNGNYTCVRPADASAIGKEAHGFALDSAGAGDLVTLYLPGNINYKARQVDVIGGTVPAIGGYIYLSDVEPGCFSMSPPTISGHFVQKLGLPIMDPGEYWEALSPSESPSISPSESPSGSESPSISPSVSNAP